MKKTILLVDDEIDILDIQHRYLIQAGYDVLVAHDGKEGLELFRKKNLSTSLSQISICPIWTGMILSVKFSISLRINPSSLQLLRQANRIRFMIKFGGR